MLRSEHCTEPWKAAYIVLLSSSIVRALNHRAKPIGNNSLVQVASAFNVCFWRGMAAVWIGNDRVSCQMKSMITEIRSQWSYFCSRSGWCGRVKCWILKSAVHPKFAAHVALMFSSTDTQCYIVNVEHWYHLVTYYLIRTSSHFTMISGSHICCLYMVWPISASEIPLSWENL